MISAQREPRPLRDGLNQVCLEPPAEGSPEDGIVHRPVVLARSGGQLDSLNNFEAWPMARGDVLHVDHLEAAS